MAVRPRGHSKRQRYRRSHSQAFQHKERGEGLKIQGGYMTRILSIVNQKGGVGKTTTTVNLATALAAVQKNVLVVDFDPQGNASTGLGVENERRDITSYDLILSDIALPETV